MGTIKTRHSEENKMAMTQERKAVTDYDGSVWIEGFREPYTIPLALDDKYRVFDEYPIELFNDRRTVLFPFGRYYL